MALRTRLLLSLVLIALVPLLLFGITAYSVSTNNLIEIERGRLLEALNSVDRALTSVQNNLASTTRDYANWDDTHDQIASGEPTSEYIIENLTPDTETSAYNTFGLGLVGLWKQDGSLHFGAGPVDSITSVIAADGSTLLTSEDPVASIQLINDELYIVAIAPVRRTDGSAPNGFMAFGRKLGAEDLEQIKALTSYDVALYRETTPVLALESTQVANIEPATDKLRSASRGNQELDLANTDVALAYNPVKNNQGETVATLVVWRSRSATTTAQNSISNTMLLAFIFGAVLALLVGFLLQRSITNPLTALVGSADKIAAGDLSQRVGVRSQDEFGRLAKAFNQMAERVSERFTETTSENQRLQSLTEYRQNLLTAITQELQSPIENIKSYTESLNMNRYGTLNDAQQRLVSAIERSINLQQALVADLVDFSNAQRNQLRIQRERLPVEVVAKDAVQNVQQRFADKSIQYSVSIPGDTPPMFADRTRMIQILENLLNWAYNATIKDGRVMLSASSIPGMVRISISDTSQGLSPEQVSRVFDLFYRADGGNSSNGKSDQSNGQNSQNSNESGLGLALVKALIEQHGGTITVNAVQGQGNTFTFLIPSTN